MGLCFCTPQNGSPQHPSVSPHTLSYKIMKTNENNETSNQINNTTILLPSYKPAEIFNTNHEPPRESEREEETDKDYFVKSQTEILVQNEGQDFVNEENSNPRKGLRIEDFELLKVFLYFFSFFFDKFGGDEGIYVFQSVIDLKY